MSAIEDRYEDAGGVVRLVPAATRKIFAGLFAATAIDEPIVPHAILVRRSAGCAFPITLPASSWPHRIGWTIVAEDATVFRGEADLRDAPVIDSFERDGVVIDRRRIDLPDLPLGYHRLAVDAAADGAAEATVIVVPDAAYLPPLDRSWGIAVQLYTLRSERNWGIGDFTDLRALLAIAAGAGASYVGLNPLHAPHRSDPGFASPYAPTSRRFLNWLAIDVAALPEAREPAIAAAIAEPDFAAQLDRLRAEPFVDYNGVAECKDAILRRCYAHFAPGADADEHFRAFVARGGSALERFAIFETLVERLGRNVAAWPPAYRAPTTLDVAAFAAAERPAIEYALYLQWRASQQFAIAAAEGAGRGVLLYRDLAVGVDASGADIWLDPQTYVAGISVGAPPDPLGPDGQDWGLPPLHPRVMQRDGYAALAAMFRANMTAAGALRIDHAMSLQRLFWIPRGAPAADGGYVDYPLDDVLGVLALESVRAECLIVGEDLGTVPSGFRERMALAHLLSYRILFFEREHDGGFIPAERYPALSLAATGTHDLAPFAAWLDGSDIDLRERLSIYDAAAAAHERTIRARDRDRLIATLRAAGDLRATDADADADEIVVAAHRFLARSPAMIVMMQLDDALGEREPVNVPGTSDSYPNWRRRLSTDIDAIAADARFVTLCAALRAERPRPTEEKPE